jgi:roadblock/LC7 domain-containing protein
VADIKRLMGLSGAVAVYEFTPDGELVSYKGDVNEEIARLVARMTAANTLLGSTQAETFTRISGMKWMPFHGWAVAAGDYSVCVMGHLAVFVETAKADFNTIFKILGEEAHITLKAA